MIFVCTVDGRIAGNCQISFTRRIKTRHRATLAIGILEKFWGLGIGTAMFTELERRTAFSSLSWIILRKMSVAGDFMKRWALFGWLSVRMRSD